MRTGPIGPDGLTDRDRLFCGYYAVHLNASRAAREVGAARGSSALVGFKILHKPAVQARLKKQIDRRCEKLQITADQVLESAAAIALHDPTKISQMRRGPCHRCWDCWDELVADEQAEARELADLMGEPYEEDPEEKKRPDRPDPDCPGCYGDGEHLVWFADTRDLGPLERLAYQGASITKDGHKVDVADRLKALDLCAKLMNLYKDSSASKPEAVNIYFDGMKLPPIPPPGK